MNSHPLSELKSNFKDIGIKKVTINDLAKAAYVVNSEQGGIRQNTGHTHGEKRVHEPATCRRQACNDDRRQRRILMPGYFGRITNR